MNIFVDADAFPRPLKEVIFKVALREQVFCFMVAAQSTKCPNSDFIKSISAGSAFNGADDWIVDHLKAGDLVITADIPLADRAIDLGADVLNPKGDFWSSENIKNALAMRNLMEELRITGEITGGPAPFSPKQRIKFIDALNRYLQKKKKS